MQTKRTDSGDMYISRFKHIFIPLLILDLEIYSLIKTGIHKIYNKEFGQENENRFQALEQNCHR